MPVGQGTQTNDLGEFRLFGLPAGDYLVVANLAQRTTGGTGTTIVATYFPGTTDASAAESVAVAAGQEVTGIAFRMAIAPAFRVSGIVVDETGAPVSGAMVMLMPGAPTMGAGGPPGQGSSDTQGRFVVGGVAPGSYRLTAVIPMRLDGQGASAGGFVGGTFFSAGSPTSVAPSRQNVVVRGADVTDVRLVVQRSR